MNKLGIQLYSVRDRMTTETDIIKTFNELAQIGYTQAQTAGDFVILPDRFAKYAHDAGIEIIGTHYDWKAIKNDTENTVRLHEMLGTTTVGIGGMPKEARESLDTLKAFIEDMNRTAAKLKKYGCKLTYHNHSFEFKKFDGKTMMDYMIEGFTEDNISFVLDTYWVQHGGADIRRMIERLSGRIDILHLKDMAACGGEKGNAPYITDIGYGNIDFSDIVPLAEKTGVKYFCVEQDGNYEIDSMTSAKTCFNFLKKNVME